MSRSPLTRGALRARRRHRPLLVAAFAALALAVSAATALAAPPQQGDLIFGGTETPAAPWQAFVRVTGGSVVGSCTGTVIGQRWVLTAAHCLTESEGLNAGEFLTDLETVVVVGRPTVPSFAELDAAGSQTEADRVADEIGAAFGENYYISDGWDPAKARLQFDVGLIRLDRDLPPELGAPPARIDQDATFAPGRPAVFSGWGITEAGGPSSTLRSAQAPIRPPDDCGDLVFTGFTPGRNLCIGTKAPIPVGPCRGDSGGPLTAVDLWGSTLIGGISSFGPIACTEQPSAYTRVTAFSDFIRGVMEADPVAPADEPELSDLTLTPGAAGALAIDAEIDSGGAATNIELELAPAVPAAPIRRSARAGSGKNERTVRTTVAGLAPGVSYAWTSHASSLIGRTAGPTGTVTIPGAPQPIEVSPETRRCLPVVPPNKLGGSGSISLNRRQLAINQRIGQAALRRLQSVESWINEGIRAADFCGGSIGDDALSEIELGRASTPGEPAVPPSPRQVAIAPLPKSDLSRFTVSQRQLRTNQRIYQAALRRARGLRQRLRGGLTGGDIRDGELGWGALPPGAMMTRFGPGQAVPPSVTKVAPRPTGTGKRVRVTRAQLRTNQKIAQAAVREANTLLREISRGLTEANFAKGSISSRDFVPEIADRLVVGQP